MLWQTEWLEWNGSGAEDSSDEHCLDVVCYACSFFVFVTNRVENEHVSPQCLLQKSPVTLLQSHRRHKLSKVSFHDSSCREQRIILRLRELQYSSPQLSHLANTLSNVALHHERLFPSHLRLEGRLEKPVFRNYYCNMVNYDHLQPHKPPTDPPIRDYPFLEDIERQTHWTGTIKTHLTNENLAKCSPQLYSPLFRLRAKLRILIFEYACLPYDDDECRYKEEASFQFYQPEHQVRHITSTGLLVTCRLAWLEANHLPLELGDHSFFFSRGTSLTTRRPRYLAHISGSEDKRLESTLITTSKASAQKLA